MSTSKLGEEGLKFLVEAFEKLKGLKDTDILKNIIEHIENIQTLAEEKLYAARIGLAFFRDILDSEEGSALIPTSEKAKVDGYLDKLELVMEERMVITTQITKLVGGRQKKLRNVWRENFIRIAKHKKLFEGEFPVICEPDEEETAGEEKEKKKSASTSAYAKIPLWLPIIAFSSLVLNILTFAMCIFCFQDIKETNAIAVQAENSSTLNAAHLKEATINAKKKLDSLATSWERQIDEKK